MFVSKWIFVSKNIIKSNDVIRYNKEIFISFILPVILNLIYLLKSHKYIRSINQIQNEQILLTRKKQNKKLLIQSIIFYSIWFILWSPNQIFSPFVNITSTTGTVTSLLNYIEIL